MMIHDYFQTCDKNVKNNNKTNIPKTLLMSISLRSLFCRMFIQDEKTNTFTSLEADTWFKNLHAKLNPSIA